MAVPEVAGVRLLEAVPTEAAGGPVVAVDAVRLIDGLPVQLILVTAELDSRLRRRIRTESANLEAVLAELGETVVVPLLDHGADPDGRPFLLAARPGPGMEELLAAGGPRPIDEVPAAAHAYAAGLGALAAHGLVGSPPDVCQTASGALVAATPLPPALVELVATLGDGTGHEPPEVLTGGDWTPAGQVYACASMLWTMLAGRPPYSGNQRQLGRVLGAPPAPMGRADVPDRMIAVLRSALVIDPGDRPADPSALAARLAEFESGPSSVPSGYATIPPVRSDTASRPLGSRYLLEHRIGQGATGHVWVGRRREDDSPIAVKLLRSELSDDPDVVTRFMRERAVLKGLRHPHLVRVHDLVAEGDVLGIVMDLVDGEDLRRVAARVRLTAPAAAALLAQTASALAAVHDAGIVHRDVKPENILITERDGRRVALLSDFGIARAVEGSAHTQLIGTPIYCAPELAAGRPPEPPVDIYALGVTGYGLLAGRPPFTAATIDGVLRAHLEQLPTRPDGIDDEAWALLAACLAKDPAARPSAAGAARRWAVLAGTQLQDHAAYERDPWQDHAGDPPPGVIMQPFPDLPGAQRGLPGAQRQDHHLDAVAAPPVDGAKGAEYSGTVMSGRPLPVRPPEEPKPRKRRRLAVVIAAAAVLSVGSGVGFAALRHDSESGAGANPGKSAAPAGLVPYYIPASVVVVNSRSARINWSSQAGSLPGLSAYIVYDVSEHTYVPLKALPKDRTFLTVPLDAARTKCFQVAALVPKAPPGPQAQRTCVTP